MLWLSLPVYLFHSLPIGPQVIAASIMAGLGIAALGLVVILPCVVAWMASFTETVASWFSWFRTPNAYLRDWAATHPGEGVTWLPHVAVAGSYGAISGAATATTKPISWPAVQGLMVDATRNTAVLE